MAAIKFDLKSLGMRSFGLSLAVLLVASFVSGGAVGLYNGVVGAAVPAAVAEAPPIALNIASFLGMFLTIAIVLFVADNVPQAKAVIFGK